MDWDRQRIIVADNIRALMDAKGFNEASLARAAGTNATGVRDFLQGKSRSPRVDTLGKISEALGVDLAFLLEEQSDETLRAELLREYSRLDRAGKERLVATARAWLEQDAPS